MKPLVKIVLNNKRQRVGCVVATRISPDTVGIGWSRCMKGDRFNREEAVNRALERAHDGTCVMRENFAKVSEVAPSIEPDVMAMLDRVHRYYWPNHIYYTAPDGTAYGLADRPRIGTIVAYAPDLTPAATLGYSLHNSHGDEACLHYVKVHQDHQSAGLPRALVALLRAKHEEVVGATTYAQNLLKDLSDEESQSV